jgi:hypothetical protein
MKNPLLEAEAASSGGKTQSRAAICQRALSFANLKGQKPPTLNLRKPCNANLPRGGGQK